MKQLPKDTFYALCYGNLWSLKKHFIMQKIYDVTLYHGEEDNWTSAEKGKIFAEETNSELCRIF